jgi:uncharacterized protein (DUF1330 family)
MAAYLIYFCQGVTDRKELEVYWSKIGATFEGHPAKMLALYAPFEVLEGEPLDGVVVAEFPSFAAAKAWYDSPAYRAIRHHRMTAAKYLGVLVEAGAVPASERMPHTRA